MRGRDLRHPGPFGFDDTDCTLADPAKAGVSDSIRSRSCRLRVTKIPTAHDDSELEPTRRTSGRDCNQRLSSRLNCAAIGAARSPG
jgi:hypothetical protein